MEYKNLENIQNKYPINNFDRTYVANMINSFIKEDIHYLISQTNRLEHINKKTKILLDSMSEKKSKNIESKL